MLRLLLETPKSFWGNGVEINLFSEVTLIISSTKSISPVISGRQLGVLTKIFSFCFSTVKPSFNNISSCFSIFIAIPVTFSTLLILSSKIFGLCGFFPAIIKSEGSPPNKFSAN